jgi:hypothetical protein
LDQELQRLLKKQSQRITRTVRERVLGRDCGCRKCGDSRDLTIHHIVPRKIGGTNHLDNLLVLCSECHVAWERACWCKLARWFQIGEWLGEEIAWVGKNQIDIAA